MRIPIAKTSVLLLLFLTFSSLFSQSSWTKIYSSDWGIYGFKIVRTNDPLHKILGITKEPSFPNTMNSVGTNYTAVAYYNFKQDTAVVIGTEGCYYTSCHGGQQSINCGGISWMDIAPFQTTRYLSSSWAENSCPNGYAEYTVDMGNCQILESGTSFSNSISPRPFTSQSIFFHPTDSTILYSFDKNSGLLVSHFTTCPQNWQILKATKNPSYFLIMYDHPNLLFLTADDTLWHSTDSGNTWNMSVNANINSISYFPKTDVFVASSPDSASKGLYRSLDSGKIFVRMDTSMIYSVTIDTITNAIYVGTDSGIVLRSNDTGKTFFRYNNTFTQNRILSVTANVYGNLIGAAADGIYKIHGSGIAPLLIAPKNDTVWIPQPLQFQWGSLNEAVSYHLQVAVDTNFTNIIVDDSGLSSALKQLDSLQPNTQYFWRVRAILNSPATSVWSQTWKFTTLPLFPSQAMLISPHNDTILYNTRVDFLWKGDQNAPLHYWFEIADNDSLRNSIVDSTLTDTIAATYEPLITQTYWWRVRAQNAAGWGQFSPVYHFTMLGSNDVAEMNTPVKSGLIQNYPNPFTSSTLIRIPSQLRVVSLKIYDALGREVADLSAKARSGNTAIPLDGSRLPAGVYACRMQAGATMKQCFMTLMK